MFSSSEIFRTSRAACHLSCRFPQVVPVHVVLHGSENGSNRIESSLDYIPHRPSLPRPRPTDRKRRRPSPTITDRHRSVSPTEFIRVHPKLSWFNTVRPTPRQISTGQAVFSRVVIGRAIQSRLNNLRFVKDYYEICASRLQTATAKAYKNVKSNISTT